MDEAKVVYMPKVDTRLDQVEIISMTTTGNGVPVLESEAIVLGTDQAAIDLAQGIIGLLEDDGMGILPAPLQEHIKNYKENKGKRPNWDDFSPGAGE